MARLIYGLPSLVLLLLSPNAATAKTKIDVYWKYIAYEISPQQARHESQVHDVIILDGNTVSVGNAVGHLGEVFNSNNGNPGGDYAARVTVRGGTIDAEFLFSGSRTTERIRNGRSNTCSASVFYSRLKGQRFFTRMSSGELITLTRREASDIYCTIVQE